MIQNNFLYIQDHLHHRLVRLGLSQAGAAMTLVGISLILGIMALLFAQGIHTELQLFSKVKQWIQ